MPGPITAEQALVLNGSLRHLIEVVERNTAASLAGLPQVYDSASLQQRWKWSEEKLAEELRARIGYAGSAGKRMRIHLSDVLKVDEQLRKERLARIDSIRLRTIA